MPTSFNIIDPAETIDSSFNSSEKYFWDPSFISYYKEPICVPRFIPTKKNTKLFLSGKTSVQDNDWIFGKVNVDFSNSVLTGIVESSDLTSPVPFSLLNKVRVDLQTQLKATEDAIHTLISSPTTIKTFNNMVAQINRAFAEDASNATTIFASLNATLNNYETSFTTKTLNVTTIYVGDPSINNTIYTDNTDNINNMVINSHDHDINLITSPTKFVSMKNTKVDTIQAQTIDGNVTVNSNINMNNNIIANLRRGANQGEAVAFEQYAELYNWALHVNYFLFKGTTLDQNIKTITKFPTDGSIPELNYTKFVNMNNSTVGTLQTQTLDGNVTVNSIINMNNNTIANLRRGSNQGEAVAFEQYAELYNWALHLNYYLFRGTTLDQNIESITEFPTDGSIPLLNYTSFTEV
jgi:hypothetical protein